MAWMVPTTKPRIRTLALMHEFYARRTYDQAERIMQLDGRGPSPLRFEDQFMLGRKSLETSAIGFESAIAFAGRLVRGSCPAYWTGVGEGLQIRLNAKDEVCITVFAFALVGGAGTSVAADGEPFDFKEGYTRVPGELFTFSPVEEQARIFSAAWRLMGPLLKLPAHANPGAEDPLSYLEWSKALSTVLIPSYLDDWTPDRADTTDLTFVPRFAKMFQVLELILHPGPA